MSSSQSASINWTQSICREVFHDHYMINDEKEELEVLRGVAEVAAMGERKRSFRDIGSKGPREEWKAVFLEEMLSGRFIPAGRILANARPGGRVKNFNNCFTIDIDDSMEGIFDSLKEDAMISKVGGGVGFDVSKLRPRGDKLSVGGEASGPISFLEIFDQSAKVIKTGGSRRAAHIALMDVSHPDIEDFITVKHGDHNKRLSQFNLSVRISDEFMAAVKSDADWNLVFEGKIYRTVKARDLYHLLAKNAFEHNEPGVFYRGTVSKYNNAWWALDLDRCNPCGEIVMPAYSLCCLGELNLVSFVLNPFTPEASVDWETLEESVSIAVRFLDNLLDVTEYPLEKIEVLSKKWRRIGLGFTGLGDMMAMLGIVYGSQASKDFALHFSERFRNASYRASVWLAQEKGQFPACKRDQLLQSNFIKKLPKSIQDDIRMYGLRNIGLNTVPPAGTISLSIGQNCSSGIEPIFSLSYDRTIRTGVGDETKKETVYDYAWLKYLDFCKESGVEPGKPSSFVTTFDIAPKDSIDVQAAIQENIDHSISKTLNLPRGFTFEQYLDLFVYGYEKGLKGFTTFNPEGSMKGILEAPVACTESEEKELKDIQKRPDELPCDIHEIVFEKKKYLVLVGLYGERPYEIFVTPNEGRQFDVHKKLTGSIRKIKKGKYDLFVKNGEERMVIEDISKVFDPTYSTLGRFISMSLRYRVPLPFIIEQLQKSTTFTSFEKIVSRVLKKYLIDGEKVITADDTCQLCGEKLVYQSGCAACPACGWSQCS